VLNYTADKRISVNKHDITHQRARDAPRNIYEQRKDKTMFIMAAGTLRYKDIIDRHRCCRRRGVEKGRHRHRRHAQGRRRIEQLAIRIKK
jgi:biopolymer transport protein ExbD